MNDSEFEAKQQRALELWKADRVVFGEAQEKSARALGAALADVKAALPHGEYGKWLKKNGIDHNRANYCVRVAVGKQKKPKKPKVPKEPRFVCEGLSPDYLRDVEGCAQEAGQPVAVYVGQLLKDFINLKISGESNTDAARFLAAQRWKVPVLTEEQQAKMLVLKERDLRKRAEAQELRERVVASVKATYPDLTEEETDKAVRAVERARNPKPEPPRKPKPRLHTPPSSATFSCTEEAFKKFMDDVNSSQGTTISSRMQVPERILKVANEIVSVGMKTLAQTRHPDHGGSQEDMQLLNLATKRLRQQLQQEPTEADAVACPAD